MRQRPLAWVGLAIALTGCAKGGSGELEPAGAGTSSENAAAMTPVLTEMLVLRATGAFEQGDTVRVEIASVSEENQVTYHGVSGEIGFLAYDALGPAGEGTMVVTADELNVRRCRSTGCSVVGQVVRGQEVSVYDFQGRWYRYNAADGTQGYLRADYLVLPAALENKWLIGIRQQTADYYNNDLSGISVNGDPVITGYDVKHGNEMLAFRFYTPFDDGPALAQICNAMRDIAGFTRQMMAQAPAQLFPAYSASVYLDKPDAAATDDIMLAGLSGGTAVYCVSPD